MFYVRKVCGESPCLAVQSPRSAPEETGRAASLMGRVSCLATGESTENSRSVHRHKCAPSST